MPFRCFFSRLIFGKIFYIGICIGAIKSTRYTSNRRVSLKFCDETRMINTTSTWTLGFDIKIFPFFLLALFFFLRSRLFLISKLYSDRNGIKFSNFYIAAAPFIYNIHRYIVHRFILRWVNTHNNTYWFQALFGIE